ncbi:MAG: sugar phosphate isomerase/epimerase [Lentisphaeria bacterium]|nr:sugar phosphate isomerase/epimerase [Lentisphaeria bacterium]
MMQPSMWTSYLVEWLPHDMARVFAEHGWRTCELSDEHGHDLLKLGDPARAGAEFRIYAAQHGLSFPQGHFYLATRGVRPEDREGRQSADIAPADDAAFDAAFEAMKRWVDLFDGLGIRAGVLHLGGWALAKAGWDPEAIFERRCRALARIAEYARGSVTRICVENMAGANSGAHDSGDFDRLLAAIGMPNVAICLDTGHAQIGGVDCEAFVRGAGRRLEALHIADNLGQSDDHMLPYGRGVVRWSPVVRALREVGYEGLFNFEVPGENRCPPPVRLAKLDYARWLADWMIANDGA